MGVSMMMGPLRADQKWIETVHAEGEPRGYATGNSIDGRVAAGSVGILPGIVEYTNLARASSTGLYVLSRRDLEHMAARSGFRKFIQDLAKDLAHVCG